ncbi:MAG TPA: alpha/beta hydrolase [Pseudonocardiaceae bacterium]|nr:alpha/beta hydrolase [Pseudonocardiaceae bacterium]
MTFNQAAALLPGTGSDEVFVTDVFGVPLAETGVRLIPIRPVPGEELAGQCLAALDRAAADGPILAGGISLGAHLAVEWALANPGSCVGLLLAMPGWSGPVAGPPPTQPPPAALAARASAESVDALGVDEALSRATQGVPEWLAAELNRAWRRAGPRLSDALRVAAGRPAPALAELGRLGIPVGVAGCTDDPVHPVSVARSWAAALPTAGLRLISLAELGADRRSLGRATVQAWQEASQIHPSVDRPAGKV